MPSTTDYKSEKKSRYDLAVDAVDRLNCDELLWLIKYIKNRLQLKRCEEQ